MFEENTSAKGTSRGRRLRVNEVELRWQPATGASMGMKWHALLAGSTIAMLLWALEFTGHGMPWVIYPAFPGLEFVYLALWFTGQDWRWPMWVAKVVSVVANAGFYSGICYVVLRLMPRWKQ